MVAAGADCRGGVLDGHLSRKLPAADPRRRRPTPNTRRAGRSGGRFPAGARSRMDEHGPWSDALMVQFAPLLPELLLSVGGTILMMVAAFTGRRGSGLVSWL